MQNWIITLVFEKNANFFQRKLAKIAENCDHNIEYRGENSPNLVTLTPGFDSPPAEICLTTPSVSCVCVISLDASTEQGCQI
jgi:hypothetical protein